MFPFSDFIAQYTAYVIQYPPYSKNKTKHESLIKGKSVERMLKKYGKGVKKRFGKFVEKVNGKICWKIR